MRRRNATAGDPEGLPYLRLKFSTLLSDTFDYIRWPGKGTFQSQSERILRMAKNKRHNTTCYDKNTLSLLLMVGSLDEWVRCMLSERMCSALHDNNNNDIIHRVKGKLLGQLISSVPFSSPACAPFIFSLVT